MENVGDRVKLNVGGVLFETTKTTLLTSSYFVSLFNRWTVDPTKPYFIDRSGIIFEHVLSFLRNAEYEYPKEHLSELKFYGIELIPQNISNSKIKLEYCYNVIRKHLGLCKKKYCENKKFLNYVYCEKHGKFIASEQVINPKVQDVVTRAGYYFEVTGLYNDGYNFSLKSLSGEIDYNKLEKLEGLRYIGPREGKYYYVGNIRYFRSAEQLKAPKIS